MLSVFLLIDIFALSSDPFSPVSSEMKGDRQQFMLSVKDDGVGFDLSSAMNNGANGLKNIVKRAGLAQLNCEIITQKGEGCQYVIKNF